MQYRLHQRFGELRRGAVRWAQPLRFGHPQWNRTSLNFHLELLTESIRFSVRNIDNG